MGVFDWLWEIALKKAVAKGLKAGIAAVIALLPALQQFGVEVKVDDAVLAAAITSGGVAGYEFLRNYLKSKGLKFLP
jgi:hypothetical protein